MAKEKAHIIAMKNGVPVGYVKSISYANSNFKMTQNKADAKGYVSQSVIQRDIDELTKIGYAYGYVFIYD